MSKQLFRGPFSIVIEGLAGGKRADGEAYYLNVSKAGFGAKFAGQDSWPRYRFILLANVPGGPALPTLLVGDVRSHSLLAWVWDDQFLATPDTSPADAGIEVERIYNAADTHPLAGAGLVEANGDICLWKSHGFKIGGNDLETPDAYRKSLAHELKALITTHGWLER